MATTDSSAPPAHPTTRDELLEAACCAMRLLQDRQAHVPEEMLDPRERKVLKQLRSAVRDAADVSGTDERSTYTPEEEARINEAEMWGPRGRPGR